MFVEVWLKSNCV